MPAFGRFHGPVALVVKDWNYFAFEINGKVKKRRSLLYKFYSFLLGFLNPLTIGIDAYSLRLYTKVFHHLIPPIHVDLQNFMWLLLWHDAAHCAGVAYVRRCRFR